MIKLVNFADDKMTRAQALNLESGLKHGVDSYYDYNPVDIDTEFREMNKEVFVSDRGPYYWIWKPYCILKAMRSCKDGDTLIYSDSGIEFISSVLPVIDAMDQDIMFFSNGWPHVEWCKMDVMETIMPGRYHLMCDNPNGGKEIKQVQASLIFFKVTDRTRAFVKEWILYCQMPGFIDDSPSKLRNYPTFAEHRHDQSVLTVLQQKYFYKLHWYPATTAMHIKAEYDDKYPVLINHHRRRNNEF